MSSERRQIAELAERYRVEPSLRDVYVEGSTDRHFLEWFLLDNQCDGAVVYEIQTVDVPRVVLERHGFERGNRGRLLALGYELAASLGENTNQVTCVVDRDWDSILAPAAYSALTLLTDGSCLEAYLFNQECLRKLFGLCLRANWEVTSDFIGELSSVLRRLYCIRAANKDQGLGVQWIDFTRWCHLEGTSVQFGFEEFLSAYLVTAGGAALRRAFQVRVLELEKRCTGDYRLYLNGHDFVQLLAWFVSASGLRYEKGRKGSHQQYSPDELERMLLGCVESRVLAACPMCVSLLSRLSE